MKNLTAYLMILLIIALVSLNACTPNVKSGTAICRYRFDLSDNNIRNLTDWNIDYLCAISKYCNGESEQWKLLCK